MAMDLLIYWRSTYSSTCCEYQLGDVVDVQDSGFYTTLHDFNKSAFRVVNINEDKDKKLQDMYSSSGVMINKRKNQILTDLTTQYIWYFDKYKDLSTKDKSKAK